MVPKRTMVAIELPVAVKRELEELSERRGMPYIQVMSRLVKWVSGQDDRVQGLVLGLLSEARRDEAKTIGLERLAGVGQAEGEI